ncbi:hypothetical protein LINPERHAP1_LOCUS20217 [Linum perenne]
MGTKVQRESYFPGISQMRDLTDDSNSYSFLGYCGDKTFPNGQYYNGYLPRAVTNASSGHDKDLVKRTMLEHEAIFRNQLYELHRLYRIQRDMMNEVKTKEPHKNPLASQVASENARKRNVPGFPLGNSVSTRPSTSAIENINSPLSSVKGSSTCGSPFPHQNGSNLRDVEILESRPTKARRKMFDLRLPADEYIDTEEGKSLKDNKLYGKANHLVKGDPYDTTKNGFGQNTGSGGKNNCQEDVSLSGSCSRVKTSMADLNEPIVIEDTGTSDLLFRGKIRGTVFDGKQKSRIEFPPKETLQKFHRGSDNGDLTRPDFRNSGNGKQWLSHIGEAGRSMNNLKSASEAVQAERSSSSSRSMHVLLNRTLEPTNLSVADQRKNLLRDRSSLGLDLSEISNDNSNHWHQEAVVASRIFSHQHTFAPDSSKANGMLNQNVISVQMHPHLNSSSTLRNSSQSSAQSNGLFGDRWNCNNISASNQKLGSDMSYRNGYYHNMSTGSKELHRLTPLGSYRNTADNLATEHRTKHGSLKLYHGSSYMDSKPVKDVNLNVASSNGSLNKVANQRCIEVIDLERNDDGNRSCLSWLRALPALQNEATSAGKLSFLDSSSSNHLVVHGKKSAPHSTNAVEATRDEVSGPSGCHRKILGFPIFQNAHVPKKEPAFFTSPSDSVPRPFEVKVESKVNTLLFDMNMPSEEMGIATEEKDAKVSNFRCEIDLNSCVNEDEASLLPCVLDSKRKKFTGIDLEAPIVPEVEEDAVCGEKHMAKPREEHSSLRQADESIRMAAEAIVAISSSAPQDRSHDSNCSLPEEVSAAPDPLHWFADLISTCGGDDLEIRIKALSKVRDNGLSFFEEFDYFESMTLRLVETKEEDYMPRPLVPEGLKLDETGTSSMAPTRTRRGNARRGRQRRDFQRDILPGLGSLSRHEVTEDLQTFGGLMRATGHAWQSRNSTRSGCSRGRRRSLTISPPPPPLIQQLNSVEVGFEDRSLRGWGKTTRRPRRQRCPAGNPPTLPVT